MKAVKRGLQTVGKEPICPYLLERVFFHPQKKKPPGVNGSYLKTRSEELALIHIPRTIRGAMKRFLDRVTGSITVQGTIWSGKNRKKRKPHSRKERGPGGVPWSRKNDEGLPIGRRPKTEGEL